MRILKHNAKLCSESRPDRRLPALVSKLRQLKLLHFSWPLLFLGSLVLILAATILPFGRIISGLWAGSEESDTIQLYAHSVAIDQAPSSFDEGFYLPERAKLAPDLSPEASLMDYSDENSAFYAGGNYSLIFGAFDIIQKESAGLEDAVTEPSTEETPVEIQDEDNAIDSGQEMPAEEAVDDEAVFTEPASESGSEDQTQTDNKTSEETPGAEVIIEEIEPETGATSIEIVPETEEEAGPEPSAETSLLDSLKFSFSRAYGQIFGSSLAIAQEIVATPIKSLPELGEFQSARVGLSLAIIDPLNVDSEIIQDLPLDVNASGSDMIEIETEDDVIEETLEMSESADESGLPAENSDSEIDSIEKQSEGVETSEPAEEQSSQPSALIDSSFFGAKAANAEETEAETAFRIWYNLDPGAIFPASSTASTVEDTGLWQELATLSAETFYNALNGSYLYYDAPFLTSWEDTANLKLRIEALGNTEGRIMAYVDAAWIEATFDPETELEKIEKRQRYEEALRLISAQTVFEVTEDGRFVFSYTKNERRIWETLSEMIGIGDFWKDVSISVNLIDSRGETVDLLLSLVFDSNGEISLKIANEDRQVAPGKYSLLFHIEDRSGDELEVFDIRQDFYWGVLVMNTDKDVYSEGEPAYIQMAVLDEGGHTVCDAELELIVKAPDGEEVLYSNSEGAENLIRVSEECGPETVTDLPDYHAFATFSSEGEYELRLTARTPAGEKRLVRRVSVTEGDYSVKRQAATRIYPKVDYQMRLNIQVAEDFAGEIRERLPIGFKVSGVDLKIVNREGADPFGPGYRQVIAEGDLGETEIHFSGLALQTGDILEIAYTYDAPDRSPETYLAGPLILISDGLEIYREQRTWQIASDSLQKRARTVYFPAGVYNGGATAGNNTNTDYTLAAFNWRLAEKGVEIKNAYVIMETQFEAYNNTGAAYSGYKLGFDTCEETCTAAAFGTGAGQVLDDNASTFVYDERESNIGRILLDVTNEAQLSAYTGDSVLMESQFGYRLKNSSAYTSIANVSAMLVLTYVYDVDSPSISNTVFYPLDSTNGTDNGTRQAAQTTNCTADGGACPTFNYNMAIPEWPGVSTTTNRVAQWFRVENAPYNNGTTDIRPYLDIETVNVDSTPFHFEAALSSNGAPPPMYFPAWTNSGFVENTAQQVEYFTGGAVTTYAIGGEVAETYFASSSAPIKTRTASFPMGVVNNGNSTALASKDVTVYLPENGPTAGKVDIKSAWVRLKVHASITTTAYTATVSSKAGTNATSSNQVYAYRANASIVKPIINLYYIIPAADYSELEQATALSGKPLRLNLTYNNVNFSVASAELMLTYTYSDEAHGYLTSLSLFGGQASGIPATSTTLTTAAAVFPEAANKSVLAGGYLANYQVSDTAASMGTVVHLLDTNISAATPVCAPAYRALPDAQNMQTELMRNVESAMNTIDGQVYNTCIANDDTARTTDVARVNGQLVYTYGWTNSPPISSSTGAVYRRDGSRIVDLSWQVADADKHETRAKIEYVAGAACDFGGGGADPRLDETDSSISATHQDPYIENDNTYQIGTPDGYITTASGTNTVDFDWLAGDNLASVESDYCLRFTANDLRLDQTVPATTTVYIDTKDPTAPGALSLSARTGNELILNFGTAAIETNFKEYKIFYKLYDGSDPTETDASVSSSTVPDLGDRLYGARATTSISGLQGNVTYSIAIWAYDQYGNKASSSRVDIITNDAPISSFNLAEERNDGSGIVDISIEADDDNNSDLLRARLLFATGTDCTFADNARPWLDENPANIQADYGSPLITNGADFQIGADEAWILTSPGSNTIQFDWLSKSNLPAGNGSYCLGLLTNDSFDDQTNIATRILTIDNIAPLSTGNLTKYSVDESSIRISYATTQPGSDTNAPLSNAYRIYYKEGTSGVSETDTEIDRTDLDAYNYNGATSTLVGSLLENSWYVFNIWTYDAYGNKAAATEIAIKTDASVTNQSLSFANAIDYGFVENIAVAGSQAWTFRAVVKESNGYLALASTTLRLANENDSELPYNDFAFSWDQSTGLFTEIGADSGSLVSLHPSSLASCAGNYCTLDFNLVFSKDIISSSVEFDAELISGNDSFLTDHDLYNDFYQVRVPYLEQKRYRWRNDDGGQ